MDYYLIFTYTDLVFTGCIQGSYLEEDPASMRYKTSTKYVLGNYNVFTMYILGTGLRLFLYRPLPGIGT